MQFDFIVIGAGIAGASAAWALRPHGRVLILEREDQPGYHSTGRSAALFTETYGNATMRALTRASRRFYESPPPGFADGPLLSPRGVLMLARADQEAAFAALTAELQAIDPGIRTVAPGEAADLFPPLDSAATPFAFHEPGAMDMDVHAIHRGFLRTGGAELRTAVTIDGIEPGWHVHAGGETFQAPVLVNAAGAWADEVAALAGVPAIGLVPKRRTVVLFDPPADAAIAGWCMAVDMDETFYVKPDAGRLLLSPADETPSPPTDAQPEELDIAIAVDRLERMTRLKVGRITHKWAGLRSFVADKTVVAGEAPGHPGFIWLAAQGGYGIQTAPAMATACAALATRRALPAALMDYGITAETIGPGRSALTPTLSR